MALDPRAGGPPPEVGLTLTDLLEVQAAAQGSRVFVLLAEARSHLSFAELNEAATRFANVLHALGLRAGDGVALLLPDGRAWLIALFGALKLGAWAALIDVGLDEETIAECLSLARPKVMVAADPRLGELAVHWRQREGWAGEILAFGRATPGRHVLRGDRLLEEAPPVLYGEIAELLKERGSGGVITFTWSPLGRLRGVMLPEAALAHAAVALSRRLGLGPTDRTLPTASLADRHGGLLAAFATLHSAGTLVLGERGARGAMLADYRVTWLLGEPSALFALAGDARRGGRGGGLKFILAAPGPLAPSLRQHLSERWGAPVLTGYGRPETAWFVTCEARSRPASASPRSAGSVGTPLACELAVAGPDGEPVTRPETPGEILVRGPAAMRGYVDDAEATAAAFLAGGWLRTEDRGFLARDGTLHVITRNTLA